MFEKKYKADNERIEPTRESLLSLSYKMKREQAAWMEFQRRRRRTL